MENTPNKYSDLSDEMSMKEIILLIQGYWKELWRKWWLIGLITILPLGYFIYKTFTTPPMYDAEIRFIVEGEGGSGLGALGGLLGTFGLKKPGGTNPYKILEVGISKRVVGEILFKKSRNNKFLANNILDIYELPERWSEKKPEFKDFQFKHDSIPVYNETERKAFLRVYRKMVASPKNRAEALYTVSLDEEKAIFSIHGHTEDEALSIELVNNGYDHLKVFFEEKILEDQKQTRDLLKEKADSIEYLINSKSRALAIFEDRNRGTILRESEVERDKLLLEIRGLTTAFTEAIKSFEYADYSYRDSKPLFLKIDSPIEPLDADDESLIFNIILGLFVGIFLGALFVIFRKMYRDIMYS